MRDPYPHPTQANGDEAANGRLPHVKADESSRFTASANLRQVWTLAAAIRASLALNAVSTVGRPARLCGDGLLRPPQEVLANVRPVVRESAGDSGLAAAVEVADAPVELLQCVLGRSPIALDLVFDVFKRVCRSAVR